mmetsp:Transcript_38625/g.121609  ORF Transcript_38625/g.121609 Transcript_38625/m.121609 type:complete len:87 (+) Transcript_38625:48-308(+)
MPLQGEEGGRPPVGERSGASDGSACWDGHVVLFATLDHKLLSTSPVALSHKIGRRKAAVEVLILERHRLQRRWRGGSAWLIALVRL